MPNHNGTPPYIFRYHRYMSAYDEKHDTLEEAVCAWSAGEDYGELSGEHITDATGAVVVSHDEWFGTLWRAYDKGTLAGVLAAPGWRAAHAAMREREAADLQRRREEHQHERERQIHEWQEMIRSANHRTRRDARLTIRRTWIDCGIEGIDPHPSSRQIEGMSYPSVSIGKSEMPLFAATTEDEIVEFLNMNGTFRAP